MNETYLEHHGILGQKWGVRRYQNKDGTLTSEGKKHKQDYETAISKSKSVLNEINNIVNKNKKAFKEDFGNINAKEIDDFELFEIWLMERGINSDSFYKVYNDEQSFYRENLDSINIGNKISRKILKEKGLYSRIYE